MDKFAIFILSHGRANNVITYDTLRKQGYTGNIYILVDTEDPQLNNYFDIYGDDVVVFNKADYKKKFDVGDNFNDKAAVVYARNACFDIAENLGYKYFMEYDDDYTEFEYRLYQYGNPKPIKNLDNILANLLEYFILADFKDLAMAQGGDFIGGASGSLAQQPQLKRKCMNTHILSTNRRFDFIGKVNEDVNAPISLGSVGCLFITFPLISVIQKNTQSNDGGLTGIYLDRGTYVKSFYSVMYSPSSCKVALMGDKHMRLHHRVSWNNAVPKILSESVRQYA